MASTWSALQIELLETGQNSGTWGTATNVNLGDAVLGEAITGSATVDFPSAADVTVTLTNSATSQSARNLRLNITESSTGIGYVGNLILGSGCQIEKFYLVRNNGTGAKTIKNTTGTGISVPAGKATLVFNDGTNVVDGASYFTSLTLGAALPVASGGTGLTAGTSGGVLAYTATGTLASSGALTQYGVVIGGGAGVAPTSTAAGTSTTVLHGNASGTPTFGAVSLTADVTGTLPNTAGGTGQSSAFTQYGVTYASSTTVLATTSAGTSTTVLHGNAAGAPTFGAVSLTADVSGTLPILNGGTGQTTAGAAFNALSPITTTGDLILGNGTNSATRLAIGSNTYVLTSNGTTASWVAPSVSSPGGSTTQVQYNNAGAFGGITGATTNGTALTLTGAILNGTIGATTPSTGAFTTVSASGKISSTSTGEFLLATTTTAANYARINSSGGDYYLGVSNSTGATLGSTAYAMVFQTATGRVIESMVNTAVITSVSSTGFAVTGLTDISAATSGQIKFPASQNASSNANTLDDYEEGTWTPTLGNISNTGSMTVTGTYTKIGNQVYFTCLLTCTGVITWGVSALVSMPFTGIQYSHAFTMSQNANGESFLTGRNGTQLTMGETNPTRFFVGYFPPTDSGVYTIISGTYRV